jgi:hypothetical protein
MAIGDLAINYSGNFFGNNLLLVKMVEEGKDLTNLKFVKSSSFPNF